MTTEAFDETSTAFPTEEPDSETTATTEQATTAFTTSFLTDVENKNNNTNNDEIVEKCKNIAEELIPVCGEGQDIKFDPFGRPFCVCKPSHFQLLQDDVNNNRTTVDNEIEDNVAENNNSNDDAELTDDRVVFENVGQHPSNCYVAGSRGNF